MSILKQLTLASAIALTISSTTAFAQKKYDIGATDTEIKIGQTLPFSGPVSAIATIGKAQAAYMKMINEQGGVNGRKINLIQYDDGYSPALTVEQVRKLVESDEVLLTFQLIGTPGNAAVQKYLNRKKVPQLLAGTGSERVNDHVNFPWTIGFNLSFQTEGRAYAQYIKANHPNAKIAVLYQNDDFGRDYLTGLKQGLGDKASMIVAEASYETADPTIDSQLAILKASGADLFYNASTAKFAALSIKKLAELGWKPLHILNNASNTIAEVMRPAGLENSKGIISVRYAKDQNGPEWKDDPGVNRFLAFMGKYYPLGDKNSILNSYGYSTSQLLIEILTRCGDDLTRENIMKHATSLNNVVLDLALPGILISSSPTDYHLNKQMQMARFDGQRWQAFGPLINAGDVGK